NGDITPTDFSFRVTVDPPRRAIECRIGTVKPSLLRRWGNFLERRCGGANSLGVGRAGETEGSRELGRIEDIGRFVLVEHFIDFTDQRIEPPNKTNHRPAKDAVSRSDVELFCGHRDELLSSWRIRRSRDMP